MTILDFFISRWKNWPLWRGYFGSLNTFKWLLPLSRGLKKIQCMDSVRRDKKTGHCKEVILVVWDTFKWPLPLSRGLKKIQCMNSVRRDKKTDRCGEDILAVWDTFKWPLPLSRGLKKIQYMDSVRRDKKTDRCGEAAVGGGSTVDSLYRGSHWFQWGNSQKF